MSRKGHRLILLPGDYAVCQLAPGSTVPSWVRGEFTSVTSTPDELSVFCPSAVVPGEVKSETGWRVLKVRGPFPFSTVGVVASLTAPLAEAGISVLTVATFDTDYLLVQEVALKAAMKALRAGGHQVAAP